MPGNNEVEGSLDTNTFSVLLPRKGVELTGATLRTIVTSCVTMGTQGIELTTKITCYFYFYCLATENLLNLKFNYSKLK